MAWEMLIKNFSTKKKSPVGLLSREFNKKQFLNSDEWSTYLL